MNEKEYRRQYYLDNRERILEQNQRRRDVKNGKPVKPRVVNSKLKKNKKYNYIKEDHPSSYKGYPFIALIQFKKSHLLIIVDNISKDKLKGYVIDLCGPSNVDEEEFITAVEDWYNTKRNIPLSVYFSANGLATSFQRIYRLFPMEEIIRVIGPLFTYDMTTIHSIKRRRRKLPILPVDNVVKM